jgi:hypothetical protein
MNQDISRSPVAMSGAGMSCSGPITGTSSLAKRRVIRSISATERRFGSQRTPPLAPPNGSPSRAHLRLIQSASAAHSPSETPGA